MINESQLRQMGARDGSEWPRRRVAQRWCEAAVSPAERVDAPGQARRISSKAAQARRWRRDENGGDKTIRQPNPHQECILLSAV